MSPSSYLNNIRRVRSLTQSAQAYVETTTGLGPTIPELDVEQLGPLHLGTFSKTRFSMDIPEIDAILKQHGFQSVLILGIEVRPERVIFMPTRVSTPGAFSI